LKRHGELERHIYLLYLREDEATWYATNFNAASDDILGLVGGRAPSLSLHWTAPQWQSWSAPNWTNLLCR